MVKVSIIIPVYNVASYIEICLKSVFSQTYPNIECIIVDDCGTDSSMQIATSVISDANYRQAKIVHHKKNLGLSEARNTGIRESSGDYLYFLDSDDFLDEYAIESMVTMLDKHSVDFVIGNVHLCSNHNHCLEYLFLETSYVFGNTTISKLYSDSKWYMMAWNKLVLKDFIVTNDLFFVPGIYHEDEIWSFKLALLSNSMAVCKDCIYYYRERDEGSIMSTLSKKHVDDMLTVLQTCFSLINKHHNIYLYSKLRTFYLNVICRSKTVGYPITYLSIMNLYRKNLALNFNIFSSSYKNIIKYFLCLFPICFIYRLSNKLPFSH